MLLLLSFFLTKVNNLSSPSKPYNAKKIILERLNIFSSVFENRQMVPSKTDCKSTMLIWNTVESFDLTPFRSDFIDYIKAYTPVKYVTKVNLVIGIGTKIHFLKCKQN